MASNEKRVCPICGEPTSSYMGNFRKDGLCRTHKDELKAGKIEQCNKCGKWNLSNEKCECEKHQVYTELPSEGFTKCVVCGTKTNGYAFCKECWGEYTTDEMLEILNKGDAKIEVKAQSTVEESPIIDENNVVIVNDSNKSKCITCGRQTDGLLFCPSCYYKYKNKELLFKITNCTNVELLDENYEGRYTCKDGHIVKSKSEREIDNYLFEKGISHAYEKDLPYGSEKNEVLHPDFFLPNYLGKDKHVYMDV